MLEILCILFSLYTIVLPVSHYSETYYLALSSDNVILVLKAQRVLSLTKI